MTAPRPLAAGNWKMNGLIESLDEARDLARRLAGGVDPACDVLLCPPFTLIAPMVEAVRGSSIQVGGQDCHANESGAHTGDISATMLADAGCSFVIVGHSERRADHGEPDEAVSAKAAAVINAGVVPIICVGETEAERDAGKTLTVVSGQIAGSIPSDAKAETIVVAYEPVWAIGTGRTPTAAEVAEVHAAIRNQMLDRFGESGTSIRILYGGSVKPSNAQELMGVENVDGALVGGASLKASDFDGIIDAYR